MQTKEGKCAEFKFLAKCGDLKDVIAHPDNFGTVQECKCDEVSFKMTLKIRAKKVINEQTSRQTSTLTHKQVNKHTNKQINTWRWTSHTKQQR